MNSNSADGFGAGVTVCFGKCVHARLNSKHLTEVCPLSRVMVHDVFANRTLSVSLSLSPPLSLYLSVIEDKTATAETLVWLSCFILQEPQDLKSNLNLCPNYLPEAPGDEAPPYLQSNGQNQTTLDSRLQLCAPHPHFVALQFQPRSCR